MAEQTLETALDIGITEDEYWEMSIGEVSRRINSYIRMHKIELQERASMYWTLGDLIGISVSRCINSEVEYPSLYKSYSELFDKEEAEAVEQSKRDNRSVANFLEYAAAHNLKCKKQGGEVSG